MDTPHPATAATDLPPCDTSRRFVRLLERRADGLVSFEFAIGWPELSVELLLPVAAFDEFCARNAVILLDDGPRAATPPAHPDDDEETTR